MGLWKEHGLSRGMSFNPLCFLSSPSLRFLLCNVRLWLCRGSSVSLSVVQLFATPGTVPCHSPLSIEFSRGEYWRVFPFFSPEALPRPGLELGSPALQVDSLPSELQGSPKQVQGRCSIALFQAGDGNQEMTPWVSFKC